MQAEMSAGRQVGGVEREVSNFDNPGVRWLREQSVVNAHDFLSDAECRVTPYGLYDVLANQGHVIVGTSFNTPEFAAACVARWWSRIGCHRYRDAGELLLLADAGGSNGWRPRLWKKGLQEMVADRYGLDVTVCHYPVGASKWNPVEHRLFGPISMNWSGQPLYSQEIVLGFLRGTTTKGGLDQGGRIKSCPLHRFPLGLPRENRSLMPLPCVFGQCSHSADFALAS